LVGRSPRWIREREAEGVVQRETGNGGGTKERRLFSLDETLPKLVAFLAARKAPTPETQALTAQRVEAARLKVEQRQIELDRMRWDLVTRSEVLAIVRNNYVVFRQRLRHLPRQVKRGHQYL
jgi:hypothetical protein